MPGTGRNGLFPAGRTTLARPGQWQLNRLGYLEIESGGLEPAEDVALQVWREERKPQDLAFVRSIGSSVHGGLASLGGLHRVRAKQCCDQNWVGAGFAPCSTNDEALTAAQRKREWERHSGAIYRLMDDPLFARQIARDPRRPDPCKFY